LQKFLQEDKIIMSLLNTKPRYFPTAEATESGWINPVTKELLVSVGGLKSKLALEELRVNIGNVEIKTTQEVLHEVLNNVELEKEKIMNESTPEVKTRKPYAPRKPKVIGEQTEQAVPAGMQLIGDVVEYNLDSNVGE
jgi:hypothetical protein